MVHYRTLILASYNYDVDPTKVVVPSRVVNTLNDILKVSILVVNWDRDLEKGPGSGSCDDGVQCIMEVL
jgi:hypothetical protein